MASVLRPMSVMLLLLPLLVVLPMLLVPVSMGMLLVLGVVLLRVIGLVMLVVVLTRAGRLSPGCCSSPCSPTRICCSPPRPTANAWGSGFLLAPPGSKRDRGGSWSRKSPLGSVLQHCGT